MTNHDEGLEPADGRLQPTFLDKEVTWLEAPLAVEEGLVGRRKPGRQGQAWVEGDEGPA